MMTTKEVSVTTYIFKHILKQLGVVIFWMAFSFIFFPWMFNGFDISKFSLKSSFKDIYVGSILAFIIPCLALFPYNDFKLLIQNGISRRTYWKARLFSFLGLSLLGQLLGIIISLLNPYTNHTWENGSMYMLLYGKYFTSSTTNSFLGLCFVLISTSVVTIIATFVGSFFSLFSKKTKVYTFIGFFVVGIVFINWIAIATQNQSAHVIMKNMGQMMTFIFGITPGNADGKWNPTMPFVTAIITGIIATFGSYKVTQKFKIKNE
ncbi:hypothetical protein [Liquorilactobacillus cacaonum]|uniref:ABC transporter, permease n=1 Tax=Liquorilactobacillus cacaonum DSM 21116 TaxID=1423729 RepID=A0A0R2CEN6_9LACO|nr:hypothetical protein [Liquorilactobacillus cacaonum]KRM89991.1 ABC transporter, permease [Liquorilactobacillus cacaonum DSM 21116]